MTNKTLLFLAINFFAFTHAEEPTTFVPRVYTVAFKVQPKNASELEEFNNLSQNILDTVKRSSNGLLYQTFLGLLHDIQLAVFGQESTLQIATDAIESLVDSQVIQDALAQEIEAEFAPEKEEALTQNDQATEEKTKEESLQQNESPAQDEENQDVELANDSTAEEELISDETESQNINELAAEQSDEQNEEEVALQEEYIPAFIVSISIIASKEEDMALFQEAKEVLSNLAQGSVEISQEVENFINQNGKGMLSMTNPNDQEEA